MRKTLMIFAPLMAIAAPALANPQGFLSKAMAGDNSETALGKLAASKGSTSAVRRFGAMLAIDHTKGRQQVAPLAVRYHVPMSTALAPEADAEQHKLARLQGRAFDEEFANYMVKDHTDDISDFRSELRSGDATDVRGLAQRTLPVLQKHLITAQKLQVEQHRVQKR